MADNNIQDEYQRSEVESPWRKAQSGSVYCRWENVPNDIRSHLRKENDFRMTIDNLSYCVRGNQDGSYVVFKNTPRNHRDASTKRPVDRAYTEIQVLPVDEANKLLATSNQFELDGALRSVLKNIREKLKGAKATLIWSGNGYHVYLPIQAFILEQESVFAEFEQPSKKFLRFSEKMLTNNKADPCHSNNLSFKNCMLRIPGSHNWECVKRNNNSLRPTTEVKVTQKCDGNRPAINWLLRDFRRYLIQERIDNSVAERKRSRFSPTSKATLVKRMWIETLLDIPIEDYRKEAIRRIIAPYLINIRKLAHDDAFNITKNWLNSCDKIKPLDFNANVKIKDTLRAATRVGYLPMAFNDLKSENMELYNYISNRLGNTSSKLNDSLEITGFNIAALQRELIEPNTISHMGCRTEIGLMSMGERNENKFE